MYIRLFYWSYLDSTEKDEVLQVVEESETNTERPRGTYATLSLLKKSSKVFYSQCSTRHQWGFEFQEEFRGYRKEEKRKQKSSISFSGDQRQFRDLLQKLSFHQT